MSAPADPPRDPPPGPADSPSPDSAPGTAGDTAPPPSTGMGAPEQPAGKRRPWAWIVVCALLVIVAGGLVVWALSLQSDLNDQKDQTAAAEQQAQDASAQVDDITQAVSDLGDQLAQAGEDAQGNIQQAVDALKAKLAALLDQLKPPDSGGDGTARGGQRAGADSDRRASRGRDRHASGGEHALTRATPGETAAAASDHP